MKQYLLVLTMISLTAVHCTQKKDVSQKDSIKRSISSVTTAEQLRQNLREKMRIPEVQEDINNALNELVAYCMIEDCSTDIYTSLIDIAYKIRKEHKMFPYEAVHRLYKMKKNEFEEALRKFPSNSEKALFTKKMLQKDRLEKTGNG